MQYESVFEMMNLTLIMEKCTLSEVCQPVKLPSLEKGCQAVSFLFADAPAHFSVLNVTEAEWNDPARHADCNGVPKTEKEKGKS